jgi:hypothetical protein
LSDTVLINGQLYRQKKGLAMGNNLSPWLAIVYMNFVENCFLKSPSGDQIKFWRRYFDDIFTIALNPLSSLLPAINAISSDIQFTLENSVNNQLPFLDVHLTLSNFPFTQDNLTFRTGLYIKPTHSNHILPWSSFVHTQRKIALLKSERIRATRICNNKNSLITSLNTLRNRFLANGYPIEVINKFLYANRNQNRVSRKSVQVDDTPVVRLKLPYLGESYVNNVRNFLRNTDLPVQVVPVFTAVPPLSVQVRRSQSIPCTQLCVCAAKNLCYKKNIVYEVVCGICNVSYIGETHRTFKTRIQEHLTSKTSKVYQHFLTTHSTAPQIAHLHVKVRGTGFKETLHRTAYEAELIAREQPKMNVQLVRG